MHCIRAAYMSLPTLSCTGEVRGCSSRGTAFTVACFFPDGKCTFPADIGRPISPLATNCPDGELEFSGSDFWFDNGFVSWEVFTLFEFLCFPVLEFCDLTLCFGGGDVAAFGEGLFRCPLLCIPFDKEGGVSSDMLDWSSGMSSWGRAFWIMP